MPITAFAGGHECICETKCTEDCINPDCELCKIDYTLCCGEDPAEAEPEEEPEKKNPASVLALVLLLGIGGAGGYMYLTRSKSKKTEEIIDDPDADYNEDEDDYLSSLPDDPEDFDSEIETEDDIPIEDTDKVVNKQTKDKNDSPPSLIHLIPRYKKVTTFN